EEFITKVPEVHEALEELKLLSANKEFRAAYNAHLKAQNDRISREANAEARGEARGELKKAKETALNAVDMGLTTEQAAKLSGLSIEEIESLKNRDI
ncbi:MAG: hypothetical protein LBJ96_01060, partial [Holosporaceae bacterium]|nr:hypothetical protein [Holosporaceae bacterium]